MNQQPWELGGKALKSIAAAKTPAEKAILHKNWTTYMDDRFKVGVVAGWAILGTFGAVILGVTFLRLLSYLFRPMLVRRKDTWLGRTFRTHLLEAPTAGEKRAQPYATRNGALIVHVPGRVHTMAIFALVVTNVVTCFAFYHHLPASERRPKVLGTPTLQNVRSFADRSAMLCMAQLPLIFLFAGRSGPLALLTDCSFNTMMLYHRWLGRIVALEALGHSIAFTWVHANQGGFRSWFFQEYVSWGIVSTSFFICACVFSYTAFRRFSYELFLLLHVLLVTWSFIGLWKHIVMKQDFKSSFMAYMMVTLSFWCFDILIRSLRLLLANFSIAPAGITKATSRTLPDGTLHIRVHPAGQAARSLLAPRAGQHVYVNLPSVQFGALHPVTVIAGGKEAGRTYFDLCMKPQKGFTQKLSKRVQVANNQFECAALVEGPYGHHVRTDGYGNVLLMAAGIGITHTLSVLLDMLRSRSLRRDEESSGSQEMTLIWVFRQPKTFYVALPYLVAAAKELEMANVSMDDVKITVRAFVTDAPIRELLSSSASGSSVPSASPEKATSEKDAGTAAAPLGAHVPVLNQQGAQAKEAQLDEAVAEVEESVLSSLSQHHEDIAADMRLIRRICNLRFISGRPNAEDEMRACLLPSSAGQRSLVVSCGSAPFADSVRQAVRTLRAETAGLDLDEEVFAW